MTKKQLDRWNARRECDTRPSEIGAEILKDAKSAIVKYKRKKWYLKDLLVYLIERVDELEEKGCIPSAGCLFKYQEYMDRKHIKRKNIDGPRTTIIIRDED